MNFLELSHYFQQLEETASRNVMTEILARVFREADADEIGKLCYLLQGRVVPLYEPLEFGIADKFMIRAIALSSDCTEEEISRAFKKFGDLGKAAEDIKIQHSLSGLGHPMSITHVYEELYKLTQTSGSGSQEKKIGILAELIQHANPLSARYIIRITLDKLRLGFSDMTILDALSFFLTGDKSLRPKLEDAFNVRPDIGYIAQQVKSEGMSGLSHVKAKVGAPILASLCGRLKTADDMIKKMGEVAVEPKYDGVRVQIHVQVKSEECKVKSFSRNLENTTEMFPELKDIGPELDASDAILDSEAVGVDPTTGHIIPFQETMTRKRKHDIGDAQKSVPLRFYVFDILYKDGKDLLGTPLSERRAILEKTIRSGAILVLSPEIVTNSADTIRAYHDEQIKKGLEGAVIKKWHSPYEPGRRGFSWVKFKEEEGKTGKLTDTIDCVVMGYYKGEGKRTDFGIGAFLVGVRHGEDIVTLTKIGTGVSDEMWRDLFTQFTHLKVEEKPKEYIKVDKIFTPDVWVQPKIVVEIAGDDLTRSPTHGAGIAVRFPRLVRIRTDKSVETSTTSAEVESMFVNQSESHKKK